MSGKNPTDALQRPRLSLGELLQRSDALHGYLRPGYGYTTSLGCVEMTYANAETMFPLTPLGTLVTVL